MIWGQISGIRKNKRVIAHQGPFPRGLVDRKKRNSTDGIINGYAGIDCGIQPAEDEGEVCEADCTVEGDGCCVVCDAVFHEDWGF